MNIVKVVLLPWGTEEFSSKHPRGGWLIWAPRAQRGQIWNRIIGADSREPHEHHLPHMHIERTRPAILSGVKREERRGEGHNECGLPVIVHAGSKG